jgi:hypothetical protein
MADGATAESLKSSDSLGPLSDGIGNSKPSGRPPMAKPKKSQTTDIGATAPICDCGCGPMGKSSIRSGRQRWYCRKTAAEKNALPEAVAKREAYKKTSEGRAANRKYANSPKGRISQRKYIGSEKGRATRAEYGRTPKARAAQAEYRSRPEVQEAARLRQESPEYRAVAAHYRTTQAYTDSVARYLSTPKSRLRIARHAGTLKETQTGWRSQTAKIQRDLDKLLEGDQ